MEFGLGSRPFRYKEQESFIENQSKNGIDYWLSQWIETHNWLLNREFFYRKNIKIICYENLCADKVFYKDIGKFIRLTKYNSGLSFKESKNLKIKSNPNKDLLEKANSIYAQLKDLSLK